MIPLIEGQTSLSLERIKIPNSSDYLLCDVSLGYPRPYIPPSLRRRFFDAYHQHRGIRATQHLIRGKVVWPGINKDVRQWCRSCIECQRTKIYRHTKSPFQTFPIPDERFQHIHIDIVGPLPSDDGYSYILTMIDRFTRWPEEMVYGTTLALPADFIVTAGNFEPGTFGKQLCERMTRVRSRPTRPTRQQDIYMPPGLQDCSHVFVRKHPRPPLCPPYEGPFPVIRRSDKTITIRRPKGEDTVTVDRVKPAHLHQPIKITKFRFATAKLEGECCSGS
ncbi:uncharacterized protein [Penaeus vannamei]|uniref:uncharacterized protein n=1 Tax=Penaeus vannamei TaxID=6689 RepID=UPI00387FA59C